MLKVWRADEWHQIGVAMTVSRAEVKSQGTPCNRPPAGTSHNGPSGYHASLVRPWPAPAKLIATYPAKARPMIKAWRDQKAAKETAQCEVAHCVPNQPQTQSGRGAGRPVQDNA